MKKLLHVPIEVLQLPQNLGRQVFENLNELAQSITEHGMLQPILVQRDGPKYNVIVGSRRYKAAQKAGLTTVPALELDGVDEETLLELQLTENIRRQNFLPFETMELLAQLRKKGMKLEDLAKKTGLSLSKTSSYLTIHENLPEYLQSIVDGRGSGYSLRDLTIQKALLLAQADLSHDMLDDLINKIETQGMTVTQLKQSLATSSKSQVKRVAMSRNYWKELTKPLKEYAKYWRKYAQLKTWEDLQNYHLTLEVTMPRDLKEESAETGNSGSQPD